MRIRAPIAVTMGDPAGIGPEIALKVLLHPAVHRICRPVLIGDPMIIRDEMKNLGVEAPVRILEQPGRDPVAPDGVSVVPLEKSGPIKRAPGCPTPEGGRASLEAVEIAARLTSKGLFAAMVTGPVSKAAINAAGIPFSGHTEYLADYFGVKEVGMILVVPPEPDGHRGLKVLLVTTHVPLGRLPSLLTQDKVLRAIRRGHEAMRGPFGLESPRIAVAGLNPHGGEEGLFGTEEQTIIRPAVEAARGERIPVSGPFPADTLFRRAFAGDFDLVIALYHDQALIPVKLLGFHRSVNYTAGLPVIRTSVDHGTGFDLAGQKRADPGSLIEAVRLAVRLIPDA